MPRHGGLNLCLSEGMEHCIFVSPNCSIKMDLLHCVRMRSGISACYTWRKPSPQPWNVTYLWWRTRIFEETTLEQLPMVFAWAQKFGWSEPQPIKARTHWGSGGHQLHIQTPPSHWITSLKILLKGTKTRKQPHGVTAIKACRCWYEWEPCQEPQCILETHGGLLLVVQVIYR